MKSTKAGEKVREIITEFADQVKGKRITTGESAIIAFRNDKKYNRKRDVFMIPVDILRFRKDNGRIASDVLTYETENGRLDENTDYGQAILKRFLLEKDPERTKELENSILHDGQNEVAVVTSDGFLINGNRRKLVLENLLDNYPTNSAFKYLKVVILPGISEPDPPPTISEIEQIENRYQLQTLGKAEYYNFDKALSIRRKIQHGMSLKEQLLDDPNYASLPPAKFDAKLKRFEEEYLKPLECIDRYLEHFGKKGQYNSVSSGMGDKEGRWQAFLDYYKSVYKKLSDDKQLVNLEVTEDEVGLIEDIAFKIIRKRDYPNLGKKVHEIMRDLPKLLKSRDSRRELFQLVEINPLLSKEESQDSYGKPIDGTTKDIIWDSKYSKEIVDHVKKAFDFYLYKKEKETPVELIKAALNKLNHEDLIVENIEVTRLKEAMTLVTDIIIRANGINDELQNCINAKNQPEKPKRKKVK